jgi:hypothetical protein
MKKYFVVLPVFLALLAACSNPLLKWIETPGIVETLQTPVGAISDSDKAITSFSFGILGETVMIRGAPPEGDDKTPITVILPAPVDKSNLIPAITFIGKALWPASGVPQNFNSPVTYRVTGRDDSWRDYEVEVLVKNASPALLKWFDLELPATGLMAEGIVIESRTEGQPGDIVIHVPSRISLSSLTAHVLQTGVLSGPGVINGGESGVTLTGDFSAPRTYTVTAADGSKRAYEVTVIKDKDKSKEITAFSFAGLGDGAASIIGAVPGADGRYPIIVTVPLRTDISALNPVITHTGVSITGSRIPSGGAGTVTGSGTGIFPNPAAYTVTAEDGSIREYTVTVFTSNQNSGKQITGFYFLFPNAQGEAGSAGIINETAKTIAVTVPAGTDLRSLAPTIYHTGVLISPISGEPKDFRNSITNPVPYTVMARDGSRQTYMVSVYTADKGDKAIVAFDFAGITGETTVIGGTPGPDGKIPIVVTVPPYTDPSNTTPVNIAALKPVITHTGYSITGGGVSVIGAGPGTVSAPGLVDFTNPVPYWVTAEDKTSQGYAVTVIKPVPAADVYTARIDAFYFTNPVAIGAINQGARTIAVTVPWNTNLPALTPTIHYTGQDIKLGSAGVPETGKPAIIPANFSTPQTYTVRAQSGAAVAYTVTVSPAPNTEKTITALSFVGIPTSDTTVAISSAPDSTGKYPIEAVVPPGTNTAALAPVITHTGASVSGPGVSGSGTGGPPRTISGSSTNFSSPVSYRVTAEDGSTRDYLISVRAEDNNAKEITGFYFTSPLAAGLIDQGSKTITVKVPYGTNLGSLSPAVYYTGVALDPASGRANNFSSPAIYTVRARNGTGQPYTVKVTAGQSSAKEITAFSFPGAGVLDTIIGSVPGPDGKIPISITVSRNTAVDALKPSVTHTGKTISPAPGTVLDFRTPVSYQVTAEDGSTKDYTVSVHISGGGNKIITAFIFKAVPLSGGSAVQAVGAIDQDTHTIEVILPASAAGSRASLAPTVSYIGASLTPPAGQAQTANPLTDVPRNFTGPLTYRVNAADGTSQAYTVRVTMSEQNVGGTVTFRGISDPDLIRTSFDQSTGTLTLTLNTVSGYGPPYEWYLDGGKLGVSNTEPRLTLRTADLQPGQHEVVVVVAKTGSGLVHYTNRVYFLVNE